MIIPDNIGVAFVQLASADASIRKLGAQALCRLRPRLRVVEVQQAFLSEENGGVAKWLALALGQIGDPSSLPLLEERLSKQVDSDLRHWILVSQNMLRRFADDGRISGLLFSGDPIANREGLILSWRNPRLAPTTVRLHHRLLENSDPSVRRWATLSLGSRSDFAADDQIVSHLDDPDYLVAEWTEHVMSGQIPPAAVPRLVRNLGHTEARVREWAIITDTMRRLAFTGSHSTGKSTLIKRFRENRPDLRISVIEGIPREIIKRGFQLAKGSTVDSFTNYVRDQLRETRKHSNEQPDVLISDRTVLDAAAYASVNLAFPTPFVPDYFREMLLEVALCEASRFDLFVYCPVEFPMEQHEVRPNDEHYRSLVGLQIRQFLIDHKIHFIEASGDVDTRLQKLTGALVQI